MACLGGSHSGGAWPLLGRPFTCRAEVTSWKLNQRASCSSVWSTFSWVETGQSSQVSSRSRPECSPATHLRVGGADQGMAAQHEGAVGERPVL